VTLSNGEVGELGGEWLSSDQVSVIGLADELGIPLTEVGVDFACWGDHRAEGKVVGPLALWVGSPTSCRAERAEALVL